MSLAFGAVSGAASNITSGVVSNIPSGVPFYADELYKLQLNVKLFCIESNMYYTYHLEPFNQNDRLYKLLHQPQLSRHDQLDLLDYAMDKIFQYNKDDIDHEEILQIVNKVLNE
jgi:hypothetical protein